MHASALDLGREFFKIYANTTGKNTQQTIIDIGAQDVNGSLRSEAPADYQYIGVDFIEGKGVDVIMTDPYQLPFPDNSADIVVCSSVFEHSEFFWELYIEILRILKPHGVLYLCVPSNGNFHRYPVDCYRFYPDAGIGLAKWGQKKGFNTILLESFIANQDRSQWNDFVAVFLKDKSFADNYPVRIQSSFNDYKNGLVCENPGVFTNPAKKQEDQHGRPFKRLIQAIKRELKKRVT
jgi:SAM-dependent methyltransferase